MQPLTSLKKNVCSFLKQKLSLKCFNDSIILFYSKKKMIDIDIIRADFPILKETVNGKPLVYLDNAAAYKNACLRRCYEWFGGLEL